ncbi:dephospho-CoA kinase [Tepidimicrobium xylanilyticum]|uniref:Dephospho-CoA kinase n=1 Tax=Tepidimicrobium xylanilyticum TaxID=1123352 RepID=A0A1H3BW99_9FIRM|nr:dephospho-CoA kinase [Tepidimicrobium xylanilyticum]GMG97274.1 dephospho-CoA kinase [Tepidimicrobium xylanilyticum]SDX46153.1 dephospho-CoA kinase [Tepidimicrobium xylanilyticum]
MNPCNGKIIGLTGGIATGKSTVSNILRELGYEVIDADIIARQMVEIGKPAYEEIINVFGKNILDDKGNINRKELASIIFRDFLMRKRLNDIVHPFVFREISRQINEHKDQRVIFVDVPLLIEELDKFKEYEIAFDEIWLVYVDENTQLNRLIKRDKMSKEEGLRKIRAQMPIDEKRKYATRIIDNSKDLISLRRQVLRIIEDSI